MWPLIRSFFSFLCLILLALGAVITALLIIIFGGIASIIPISRLRHTAMKGVLIFPLLFACFSNAILRTQMRHRWVIQGEDTKLTANNWYLLISNHQSWLDILVLWYVFNRKIPMLKFFMKRELLWSLPILGWSCWIMGFPFMRRHTPEQIRKNPHLKQKDIETAHQAAEKFKEFPTTVMNFIEGTRFTEQKRANQNAPYLHLLKPKAGGVATIVTVLKDRLSGIINVTIHYSQPKMSFLKYFFGKKMVITVRYEWMPLSPDLLGDYYGDREYRKYLQQRLNALWQANDLWLDRQ